MKNKNVIAEFKSANGFNITELASALGISKGHACDLVHGKGQPGRKVAAKMAELTGRPWYEFVAPPTGVS